MMTRTDRRRFPVLLAAIAALLVFIAVDAASSPVQAQTPSADASLSSLSLSDVPLGDMMPSDIPLSPEFSAEVTSYTASVESTVTSTTVTAETTDEDATAVIMINGVEDADGTVDLVGGYNVITVEVTASDGTTTQNREARRFEQLDPETINFIQDVERVSGARVSLISTGFSLRSIIDRRSW